MTVFGLPWWFALALLVTGILIGNLVIPYDDRRPSIAQYEDEPSTGSPTPPPPGLAPGEQPAICRDRSGGELYERFPLCP